MQFSFDLISDLHLETWPEFDWEGQATSQFCIIAGDVCKNYQLLSQSLGHLSDCYQGVFYIDGNDEHKQNLNQIGVNYKEIQGILDEFTNVIYLQDNAVVVDGVAILATNGWWTWDFDNNNDPAESKQAFRDKFNCESWVPEVIENIAFNDVNYLSSSVKRLQTHSDVKKIIVVTHTVPSRDLISHDIELVKNHNIYNTMGNSFIQQILHEDSENKISHWCFGHYHGSVDQVINGIRYVNNCKGRGDTQWKKSVYHPLRIEVNF